jgi:hypothetical protein
MDSEEDNGLVLEDFVSDVFELYILPCLGYVMLIPPVRDDATAAAVLLC